MTAPESDPTPPGLGNREICPGCGKPVPSGEQTCQECGRPLPYAPGEREVACRVCGAAITAYTETCPGCGERGYPALRPRRGKRFKGSPAWEAGRRTEDERPRDDS